MKQIELNNKCKTAASCKDIVRCSIRRNSADRYAYENISSALLVVEELHCETTMLSQVNWRLRSSDRVRTHDDLTHNTKGFADAWTCKEVCNHVMSSQVM